MELKELCEHTMLIFNITSIKELSEALYKVCVENDVEKLAKFKNLVKDLQIDWLQKIFQYYEADRKEKKQDYTPKSLAMLVAELTEDDEITDYCAGSGSLTIQMWGKNPNAHFNCYEIDEKVIPYLLFNLQIRNIDASVINSDILAQKIFKAYKLTSGNEFSKVEVVFDGKCDKQSAI